MTCPCSNDHVSELQEQAKLMEYELHRWVQYVNDAREQFYPLNYYTTGQLLYLQKEFGATKCLNHDNSLSHQAVLMLQSISIKVTGCEAHKVIQKCLQGQVQTLLGTEDTVPSTSSNNVIKSSAQVAINSSTSDQNYDKDVRRSSRIAALTLIQKAHFDNLLDMGFNPDLILAGLAECINADIYDLLNWCNENFSDSIIEAVHADTSYSNHATNVDTARELKRKFVITISCFSRF